MAKTRTRLQWNGERVKDKVLEATKRAGDSILDDCVGMAQALVPVRTGALRSDIRKKSMRMVGPRTLEGSFGAYTVKYGSFIELGTRAHVITPVNAKALYWEGARHPVSIVHHPGNKKRPFLMPAYKRYYPQFARRTKQEMQNG